MKNLKLVFSLMLLAATMWSCSKVNTLDLERQAVEDLYNNRDKEKWEKDAERRSMRCSTVARLKSVSGSGFPGESVSAFFKANRAVPGASGAV